MRERQVPCRNATGREALRGRHYTFNDDRTCDRCNTIRALTQGAARAPASLAPAGSDAASSAFPAVSSVAARDGSSVGQVSRVVTVFPALVRPGAGTFENTSLRSLRALRRVTSRVRSSAGVRETQRPSRRLSARILT